MASCSVLIIHFSHQRYSAKTGPRIVPSSPPKAFIGKNKVETVISLTSVGVVLIVVGFAFAALSLLTSPHKVGREVRGAGIVMVGPIPIVLGSDARWATLALVLAIVLTVLLVLLYLV